MGRAVVIGLTGGIGTGKSVVLRTLMALGAEGIDADRVGHEVMAPGGPAYEPVLARFGRQLATPGGEIDRRALGTRVFGDPAALAQLEAIVHPAVADAVRARVDASTAPAVVIEAIKLFEARLSLQLCDRVWVTIARPEQQVARLTGGRGMAVEEIERRIAVQMPAAEMARRADRVIDTSGSLSETRLQALAGWAGLELPLPAWEIRAGGPADAEGIAAVLNGIVREGGLSVLDRMMTVEQERAFLRSLPARARVNLARIAGVVVAFQVLDLYATYTDAMNHVATLGTFVAGPFRGRGLGRALAAATLADARAGGFRKIVVNIRDDNPGAQRFYAGLGFVPCGRLAQQALIEGCYVDELLYERFLD